MRKKYMKYYNICLDDADYLYLGRNSKLHVQFCPYCEMVLNREALVSQAAATLKWRNKTFFATYIYSPCHCIDDYFVE